jgi:hypothetical protein
VVAGRDAPRFAEHAAGHERRVEAQLFAEAEVPADPDGSRAEVLVVVSDLEMERAMIGEHGWLAVVDVLGREIRVDARADLPSALFFRSLRGGGVGVFLRGEREWRRQQDPENEAREAGHPPSAIVITTSTTPMATMTKPVRHGRYPEYRASS